MKSSIGLSIVGAIIFGSLLPGSAAACSNIFLNSINGASSAVTVGLTLDSSPPDNPSLSLGPNGSDTSVLPVGPNSASLLHLAAQVSMGTLQASCSTSLTNDNVTGQCSG